MKDYWIRQRKALPFVGETIERLISAAVNEARSREAQRRSEAALLLEEKREKDARSPGSKASRRRAPATPPSRSADARRHAAKGEGRAPSQRPSSKASATPRALKSATSALAASSPRGGASPRSSTPR